MDQFARWARIRRHRPPGWLRSAVAVTAVLLPAAVLLVACAAGRAAPEPVELAELVADSERYLGEMVIVEGIVRAHDDPAHAWIEDEVPHRVGLEPLEAVEEMLGQVVRVVGRFDVVQDRGRVLDVEQVQVLGAPPRA